MIFLFKFYRTFIINILSICQVVLCLCALSGTRIKNIFQWTFFSNILNKKIYFVSFDFQRLYNIVKLLFRRNLFSWCHVVRFIMLVPNCPDAKLSGAKLSIFFGAKLSRCQIVWVPTCPVPTCPVQNCLITHPGQQGQCRW